MRYHQRRVCRGRGTVRRRSAVLDLRIRDLIGGPGDRRAAVANAGKRHLRYHRKVGDSAGDPRISPVRMIGIVAITGVTHEYSNFLLARNVDVNALSGRATSNHTTVEQSSSISKYAEYD